MNKPLLSICIPTYNRAKFLGICLESLFAQIEKGNQPIEILISDNASVDDTEIVVNRYRDSGYNLNYSRNSQNLGADANIGKCFREASGKYVWIFADDDFLLPGRLTKVIDLLQKEEAGVIYLKSFWYHEIEEVPSDEIQELQVIQLANPLDFIKEVNYWVTFCTGNIVNKQILDNAEWDGLFADTHLIQLSWMFPSIFKAGRNLVVRTNMIACKIANTGGYGIFEVFGRNFNLILNFYIAKGYSSKIRSLINRELLKSFFPSFVKNEDSSFKRENFFRILVPYFWRYSEFWKLVLATRTRKKD